MSEFEWQWEQRIAENERNALERNALATTIKELKALAYKTLPDDTDSGEGVTYKDLWEGKWLLKKERTKLHKRIAELEWELAAVRQERDELARELAIYKPVAKTETGSTK